jgi:hypothetical protein
VHLDGTVVDRAGEFRFPPLDMVTQGEPTVLAWRQRVCIGDAMTSEIRVHTAAGQVTSIIRSADPPVRITADEAEERMRGTIPRNVSGAEASERMARMRALRTATTWPSYRRVHVDPRGTLWVQDYTIGYPSPDGWTAFDVERRLIGRLVIPPPARGERPLQIIAFGLDELLVRRQDEDGFAHLTLFAIERIAR